MTDHDIRFFASDAAVRRIGTGLLDRSLPRAEWTHEAHLAACLWILCERPDIDADRDLRSIISGYNVAVGGVNDDAQGYHETITHCFLHGARLHLAETTETVLVGRVNALLSSPYGERTWLLRHYSRERLFSVEARRDFVGPDLAPLPELR
jgi:hypothetical protein